MNEKVRTGKLICTALVFLLLIFLTFGFGTHALPMPEHTEEAAEETTGQEAEAQTDAIQYWAEDSAAMQSIVSYVKSVTDESSAEYLPPEKRIAVFDFDGTLFGELFPTYFDNCLLFHRALHDDSYTPSEETREYVTALEESVRRKTPEPESSRSTTQYTAEVFQGMTVGEYRAYIRDFMNLPAEGFDGMTYGEAFYQPMKAVVQYLSENNFQIFISSGTERTCVRELITGTLDQWIPSDHVIGTSFALAATHQEGKDGRKYTYSADDQVIYSGELVTKNQKMNKVISIIEEIGTDPVLVFGNSSGDLAMAEYAVQNGGKAYLLLCDDTERDYGDLSVAAEFAEECREFETVSMKNDFTTIYGEDVIRTSLSAE